ncbi:hybrid sensor histidine kinase/response regulator transcription factor [uncultured Draconibacterium sp.]|uniref:hybrid sensor histidine kinase/response regulator transcription factor n=1 Tax=uncultured Draconibacterium sp. TaxID=1573823 RepID=UPI0025F90A76|nr:hybrid sensor histidine kinase/response regulator transcription factor [uncultured Draconibacterium sp.]
MHLLLFCILMGACAFGQKVYNPEYGNPMNEPWRWTQYNQLTGKGVRCISEATTGEIVFGVDRGVIFYDGINWEEQNGENGFTDDAVTDLVRSDDHRLYAATSKGLFEYYDNNWEKVFPVGEYEINEEIKEIRSLAKINGGGVVATLRNDEYGAILFYQNGKLEMLASAKTVSDLAEIQELKFYIAPANWCIDSMFCALSIFHDSQQKFWVWESTDVTEEEGKVFYFTKEKNTINFSRIFNSKDGLVAGKRTQFGEDEDGNVWLINSTIHKGISIFDGQSWKNVHLQGENSFVSINRVNDAMYVGAFGVLYIFRYGKWEIYRKPVTPIPNSKIIVYNDSRGYLWILGVKGQVARIDNSGSRWNSIASLNYHCEDKNGNQWFIDVEGRVVVKRADKWYSFSEAEGLPDAPVRIICTRDGLVCAAGSYKQQACISFFDGFGWERQLFPQLSWGVDYRAVFEDSGKNLWIGSSVNYNDFEGSLGGVIKIQNPGKINQQVTHYKRHGGTEMGECYGFGQTKDGKLWSCGSRLISFDTNKWTNYNELEPLKHHINTMGTTPDGTLWLGSRRHGVFQLKNDKWSVFDTGNELIDNNIINILPISNYDVWIASNYGFSRYDGFSWSNGVFADELTLSHEGGELKAQENGTIWLNRSSRAWKRRAIRDNNVENEDKDYYSTVFYHPSQLAPETEILVYSEEVSSDGNTYIEWDGEDAWAETPSSKLQYSYRLNKGEWSKFSNKRNITLLNIKNGTYSFEVRARDVDFNIDHTPAQVTFEVLPPAWKQAWFIALIFVFLIVIFLFLYNIIRNKQRLEKLNQKLVRHGEEIEHKNTILQEQKEQILQQTINEKEINQSKIRFYTNISHEFRTPLTLITGILDGLTGNIFNENPEYGQEQLGVVKKNANRLLRLINQLMDFRKLETKSTRLSVTEIEVVQYLKDICNQFKAFAKKYHIDLECESSLVKLNGWLDVDKLEKILYNLISNAIKNTPEGGRINIKIAKKEIGQSVSIEVVVEDTGCGIPSDKLNEIFEPFNQVEHAEQEKHEGTGIGLALVKSFVKLHRGEINVISSTNKNVQSKNGFSTQFVFQLPVSKSTYNENEIKKLNGEIHPVSIPVYFEKDSQEKLNTDYQHELPWKRTCSHVLIVEDNPELRAFLVNTLKEKYKVAEARNGAEGFKLAISVLPDLVLSDVMMPEMSGSEMCKQIKDDIRTSHIPVVLLTALTADENRIDGFETGADAYITKPFNLDVLLARINNILVIREKLKQKIKHEDVMLPEEEEVSSMDSVFLDKLKSILEDNYSNPDFKVDELSRKIGLSSRHLLYKIKSLLDISPVEFIRIFRLQKASQLLLGHKGSISEIAYETGFNDPGYFGKCFSKYFGMRPSEYVKAHETENCKGEAEIKEELSFIINET